MKTVNYFYYFHALILESINFYYLHEKLTMKKLFLSLTFLVITSLVLAQTTWNADPNHSRLAFTITHSGISDITGSFDEFKAVIVSNQPDFSDAKISLTTEVASINTHVGKRDDHLRSADFFEVEKYPKMTFESRSIKKIAENRYEVNGELTLHGITKPLTVTMVYRGTNTKPDDKTAQTAGIQITGTLKRLDFGIGKTFPELALSNEVEIKADGEFKRVNP